MVKDMDGLKIERKKMYKLPPEHTGAAIAKKAGMLKDDPTIKSNIKIWNDE
jgi:hypothetical protein